MQKITPQQNFITHPPLLRCSIEFCCVHFVCFGAANSNALSIDNFYRYRSHVNARTTIFCIICGLVAPIYTANIELSFLRRIDFLIYQRSNLSRAKTCNFSTFVISVPCTYTIHIENFKLKNDTQIANDISVIF